MSVNKLESGNWVIRLGQFVHAEFPPRAVKPGNLIPLKYIEKPTKNKQTALSTEWLEYCMDLELVDP